MSETDEVLHVLAWSTALCFVIGTLVVSIRLIRAHHRHWTHPVTQRKIVAILWMVPIYAVDSWLSLKFPSIAIYVDMIRDMYEAYVIYLFVALMIAYLGDGDEARVIRILEAKKPTHHMVPMCWLGNASTGAVFLRQCKLAVLQFVVLKPVTTFAALVMQGMGIFEEGSFRMDRGYVYVSFIMNTSITIAFYWLAMFYVALKHELGPFAPVPKFLCVKAVLFITFWQSVVIAGLAHVDWIHDIGKFTAENVSRGLQDLLICVEMFAAALAHKYAFSHHPYEARGEGSSSLVKNMFAFGDLKRDLNDVLPVALPSSFQPGAATSVSALPVAVAAAPSSHRPVRDSDAEEKGFSVM